MPEQEASYSFPTVVDSTMLSDFLACERKYSWAYQRKIQLAKPSIHLHFGGCFASGLDAARQSFWGPGPFKGNAEHALATGFRMLCLSWGNEPLDEFPPKTFTACAMLLDYYFQIHAFATDPVQPYLRNNGRPATEFTFALPTGVAHPESGHPIIYAGRFDMLGLYNGSMFVVDEKTTSQLGPTWTSQWGLRGQFIGYCKAATEYGYPVAGAIIRGLCIRATGFDHAEPIVYAPEWMISQWWEHLHYQLERMIGCWQAERWDKNFDNACTHYGGCQFRQLCETNNPEPWIETHYQHRTWNPLHKEG